MTFVGIDPGKAGGIAVLDAIGRVVVTVKMPDTDRGVLEILVAAAQLVPGSRGRAVLERVSAMKGWGVSSSFAFGRGFGALQMALTAVRMPFDLVSPVKWQNALGCRTGGDKAISRRKAEQLFPGVKVTNHIGDALLLAEYGRRVHPLLTTQ